MVRMIIEKKNNNFDIFYDVNKIKLNNLFLSLVNNLKSINIQIHNNNLFYREYIIYAYKHSAYV